MIRTKHFEGLVGRFILYGNDRVKDNCGPTFKYQIIYFEAIIENLVHK
jgi:hypothetical protein